jgi:hypothetical protein
MIDTQGERKYPTSLSELGYIVKNATYCHTALSAIFVMHRYLMGLIGNLLLIFVKSGKRFCSKYCLLKYIFALHFRIFNFECACVCVYIYMLYMKVPTNAHIILL